MLTGEKRDIYLAKLGFDGVPEPTKENLDTLIYAHQTHIPFSTVDLHRTQTAPDLSRDALFDKVVVRGRGGYCFELNKMFQALLESLGYDVTPVICRAVRGRDAKMPINHRGMIVTLDEDRLSADVGFGGPMPAGAFLLEEGVEQDIQGETYIAEHPEHGWWKVDRITNGQKDLYGDEYPAKRQTELEICTAAVDDMDFEALSAFFSAPGTLFSENEIVNLRTSQGYKGYKNGELTIRENGAKQIVTFDTPEAQDEALREHFGMA